MPWGSPERGTSREDIEFLTLPQRMRGYSDDAPILRLNLPLHNAKLSDTSWLSKVKKKLESLREIGEACQFFIEAKCVLFLT